MPVAFFMDEPTHIAEHVKAIELEFRESMEQRAQKGYILPGQMDLLYSGEQVVAKLRKASVINLSMMEMRNALLPADRRYSISTRSTASYNNSFETLVKDLKQYRKNGYRVLLLSGSRTRAKRLAEDLRDNEVLAVYSEDPFREVINGEVLTYYGHVRKGFEYPMLKFVILTETDIGSGIQQFIKLIIVNPEFMCDPFSSVWHKLHQPACADGGLNFRPE